MVSRGELKFIDDGESDSLGEDEYVVEKILSHRRKTNVNNKNIFNISLKKRSLIPLMSSYIHKNFFTRIVTAKIYYYHYYCYSNYYRANTNTSSSGQVILTKKVHGRMNRTCN